MSNTQTIKHTPDEAAIKLSKILNERLKGVCVQAVMELNALLQQMDDPKFVIGKPEKYSPIQRHFIAHVVRQTIERKPQIIKPNSGLVTP